MIETQALRVWREEDQEFEVSLDYVKPCLKIKITSQDVY